MDWYLIVAALLGGVLGSIFYQEVKSRIAKPYRWVCPVPGCTFSMRSNDKNFINQADKIHNHQPRRLEFEPTDDPI